MPLRTRVLLGLMAPRAAAGEPQRREGPAPLAQPHADLRRLRAADVLPALRARVLRPEPQALPEGGEDPRHARRRGEGARERHLGRELRDVGRREVTIDAPAATARRAYAANVIFMRLTSARCRRCGRSRRCGRR